MNRTRASTLFAAIFVCSLIAACGSETGSSQTSPKASSSLSNRSLFATANRELKRRLEYELTSVDDSRKWISDLSHPAQRFTADDIKGFGNDFKAFIKGEVQRKRQDNNRKIIEISSGFGNGLLVAEVNSEVYESIDVDNSEKNSPLLCSKNSDTKSKLILRCDATLASSVHDIEKSIDKIISAIENSTVSLESKKLEFRKLESSESAKNLDGLDQSQILAVSEMIASLAAWRDVFVKLKLGKCNLVELLNDQACMDEFISAGKNTPEGKDLNMSDMSGKEYLRDILSSVFRLILMSRNP